MWINTKEVTYEFDKCIKMNKEKLEKVSKILDIEASEVIYSKKKRFYRRIIFSLVQVGFFLTSSLLSLPFGHWDSKNSTYP